MGKFQPRLREGLGADFTPKVGAVIEVGGEHVQFGLDVGGKAGQQDREDPDERQLPLADEGVGLEANRIEKFRGVQIGGEGAQNC